MDPDRELLTVVTRLVNASCPTLPMLYILGIACAEHLTQSGRSSVVEGAARKILNRAAAEAKTGGTGRMTAGRCGPDQPRLRNCPAGLPAPFHRRPGHEHVRQCRTVAVDVAGRTPRCGRSQR